MGAPGIAAVLPETTSAWGAWKRIVANKGDELPRKSQRFSFTPCSTAI